jgi:hypothetical protein
MNSGERCHAPAAPEDVVQEAFGKFAAECARSKQG